MAYKKFILSIISIIIASIFSPSVNAMDFTYPLHTISKPECRFQNYSSLGPDCIMNLPILNTKDYDKYKNDSELYRRAYTVLWASTYTYGWDVLNGGHEGVDIATAKGTPVYAIGDGEVVYAGNAAGWGNVVKIKHRINGSTIYSGYAHLSLINVNIGDKVNSNFKIGEVGSTGNSTGNHLHFQIDLTSTFSGQPWYWSSCSTNNYNTMVNSTICTNELADNTMDPLLFLETNGAVIKPNYDVYLDTNDKKAIVETPTPIQKIDTQNMLSNEEIKKIEVDKFLNQYNVQITLTNIAGNIPLNGKGNFIINVTDKKKNKPYTGSFPGFMNFKYEENRFGLFPTGILQIDNGRRDFEISPKITGKSELEIYIGETFIKKIKFTIVDTSVPTTTKSMIFFNTGGNAISEIKTGLFYFRDNYNNNIIGYPLAGSYTITSLDGSIDFCIKKSLNLSDLKKTINIDCLEEDFSNSITVNYNDTFKGLGIVNYRVKKVGNNKLIVKKDGLTNNFLEKNIVGKLPNDLRNDDIYYDEIKKILENGWVSGIKSGYLQSENVLTRGDGVSMIKSYLISMIDTCDDNTCKNIYSEKLGTISGDIGNKYQNLTRGGYLELLGEYIPLTSYNSDYINFRDINDSRLLVLSKDVFRGNTWNDVYGESRYFQPDKVITRGEGIYLLSNLPIVQNPIKLTRQ